MIIKAGPVGSGSHKHGEETILTVVKVFIQEYFAGFAHKPGTTYGTGDRARTLD